jgi:hypothetical protein
MTDLTMTEATCTLQLTNVEDGETIHQVKMLPSRIDTNLTIR